MSTFSEQRATRILSALPGVHQQRVEAKSRCDVIRASFAICAKRVFLSMLAVAVCAQRVFFPMLTVAVGTAGKRTNDELK